MSGAGAKNGAERARKPDELERDLKKYGGAGAERERERSGAGAGAEWERSVAG